MLVTSAPAALLSKPTPRSNFCQISFSCAQIDEFRQGHAGKEPLHDRDNIRACAHKDAFFTHTFGLYEETTAEMMRLLPLQKNHWFFLGKAGSTTSLHVDPAFTHAWLTVLSGVKVVKLYRPHTANRQIFHTARNERTEPSEAPYVATLGPGDTLYIPAFWPHSVVNEEDSVATTSRRRARASCEDCSEVPDLCRT